MHGEPHLGVLRHKRGQQAGEQRIGDGNGHADPYQTARLLLPLPHCRLSGLRLGQHRLTVAIEHLTGIGQAELARGTLQQPGIQPLLQQPDPARDPRLGYAKRPRGGSESLSLYHMGEEIEIIQIKFQWCHRAALVRVRCIYIVPLMER